MPTKLTDTIVRDLPTPAAGNRIEYDTDVKGFGCRVTANGARSFVLNYRTRAGRERRYTIGSFPDWKVSAARTEAKELKQRVDRGEDPMGEVQALRAAPTVADMCERFEEEHLPKTRLATQRDYRAIIKNDILPTLKNHKVADVTFTDVDALHRKITNRGAIYLANRTIAVLSKMFSLAVRWQWRTDNPTKGIERNQEVKRHRYLSGDELGRLSEVLAKHNDQEVANIVRLLLLTGARSAEVRGMRWDQLDLTAGVWTKPGSTTKQKTEHRVPLSAPARQLLQELSAAAKGADYVFPGRGGDGHRSDIQSDWRAICTAAKISEIVSQGVV